MSKKSELAKIVSTISMTVILVVSIMYGYVTPSMIEEFLTRQKIMDALSYELGSPYPFVKPNSYTIEQVTVGATTYYCLMNGTTGKLDWYSTNVTAIFEASIGNLTSGGKIFITDGTYLFPTITNGVPNIIVRYDNLTIQGAGVGNTVLIVRNDSVAIGNFDLTGTWAYSSGCGAISNIEISHLTVTSNDTGTSDAFALRGVTNLHVHHVEAGPQSTFGWVFGSKNVFVTENYVHDPASGKNGIAIDVCEDFVVADNILEYIREDHILITTDPTKLNGTSERGVIDGNVIFNGTGSAIRLFEGTRKIVVSNNVGHLMGGGIRVNDLTPQPQLHIIKNNIMGNMTNYGLEFDDDTQLNHASGNLFYNNTLGDIHDEGMANIIEDVDSAGIPFKMFFKDDFIGQTLKDEWKLTDTASAFIDGILSGVYRLQTGTTSGNSARLNWNDIRTLSVNNSMCMIFRLRLGATTSQSTSIGFRYDGNNQIIFEFDTLYGHTTWHIRLTSGGSQTTWDLGETADTSWHTFMLGTVNSGQPRAEFWIDGEMKAYNDTNVFLGFQQPLFETITRTSAERHLDIDYVIVFQNRE